MWGERWEGVVPEGRKSSWRSPSRTGSQTTRPLPAQLCPGLLLTLKVSQPCCAGHQLSSTNTQYPWRLQQHGVTWSALKMAHCLPLCISQQALSFPGNTLFLGKVGSIREWSWQEMASHIQGPLRRDGDKIEEKKEKAWLILRTLHSWGGSLVA